MIPILPIGRLVVEAAAATGLRAAEIIGTGRRNDLVYARWAITWASRQKTIASFPQIGRVLHRDHTTLVAGVQRARELRERHAGFRALCDRLAASIEAPAPDNLNSGTAEQ
jgi:chromosomal replication initiation ATPase DnaA